MRARIFVFFLAVFVFFSFFQNIQAEEISTAELVELFISLGIITPEKATQARSVVQSENTPLFTRDLKVGDEGDDVKKLQQLLNKEQKTRIAPFGTGSPGNETVYFGAFTRVAVMKFQELYASEILTPAGLFQGTGFVGSATRKKLNAIAGVSTQAQTAVQTGTSTASPGNLQQNALPTGSLAPSLAGTGELAVFFPSHYDAPVGTKVRISGSGFAAENTISFGGTKTITGVQSTNGSELEFTVPADLPFGNYNVKVFNTKGTSEAFLFTVTDPKATKPLIEKISPVSGKTGTVVTITGTGFTSTGNAVLTGYGTLENLPSLDGKTIVITMAPPDVAGTIDPVDLAEGVEAPGSTESSDELLTNVSEQFYIYVQNMNGLSNYAVFEYYYKR